MSKEEELNVNVTEETKDSEVIRLITDPVENEKDNNEDIEEFVNAMNVRRFGTLILCTTILSLCLCTITYVLVTRQSSPKYTEHEFPKVLMGKGGVYSIKDFKNPLTGKSPRYWNDLFQASSNHVRNKPPNWGPCYEPKKSLDEKQWMDLISENEKGRESIKYPLRIYEKERSEMNKAKIERFDNDLSGLCRPGFLIIGVGKCGTSSLYHYLTGHPRVLPAFQKQIHYFKYFYDRPMKWYLSNFPTTETFLSTGSLMTGEASPGYIPYPVVASRINSSMASYAGDGHDPSDGHSPALIVIARDPLERAYSSYKYSYVQPTLKRLRKGRYEHVSRGKSDAYYAKYLFTFEEMIEAELAILKECLKPGGKGEEYAKEFYTEKWALEEFERRKKVGLPSMVNLHLCYGQQTNNAPRMQWDDLVVKYPEKIIEVKNIHLVQSFIGRGLYTLPLDWYYALYPAKDIYLVCTEDLKQQPVTTMNDVSNFLGLPQFNFTQVVNKGVYNAGSRPGYDVASSWKEEVEKYDIPISVTLKKELLSFLKPYNERLFALTRKRCDWK